MNKKEMRAIIRAKKRAMTESQISDRNSRMVSTAILKSICAGKAGLSAVRSGSTRAPQ